MSSIINFRDHTRSKPEKNDGIVRVFEGGVWVDYVNLDALSPEEREKYIERPREESPRGPQLV
jgi:hypothetical protein